MRRACCPVETAADVVARPNKIYRGVDHKHYRPALARFAEKCLFVPTSGCILWTGGTTAGRGNSARYGAFWDGKRWFAHRWAAVHIHGIDLGENQAGHCCPAEFGGPNSLCVQHVIGQTQLENLDEQNTRMKAKAAQSAAQKQFWLFVHLGIEPEPAGQVIPLDAVPFFEPPAWFLPYMPIAEKSDDCPF